MDGHITDQLPSRLNQRSPHSRLSRRGFLLLGLVSSGGLGLSLAGCSVLDPFGGSSKGTHKAANDWINAAIDQNPERFLAMHTGDASYYSYQSRNPELGVAEWWKSLHETSIAYLDTSFVFGDDQMVCIQASEPGINSSLCYILAFENDLVSHVYEYASAYDLSTEQDLQRESLADDEGDLQERINIIDRQADALNDRQFEGYLEHINHDAVTYSFLSTSALTGLVEIEAGAKLFFESFPNAQLRKYRTFGQGNLVCQQLIVEHGPSRSLSSVHVFDGGEVIRSYEYYSHAKLIQF